MKFYRRLAEALQVEPVVVATVIETKGSVPRETGAKMFICADGRIYDTIGGGAGEAKVIRHAKEILQSDAKQIVEKNPIKQLVEIDLSGVIDSSAAPHRVTEGICGGRMQVLIERWAGARAVALVEEILNCLESGRECVLATPLAANEPPYLLFDETAKKIISDSGAPVFIERLQPSPVLLIVGAGHVGIELAKTAQQIGFEVVLQDDRLEQLKSSLLPGDVKISMESIAETLARFSTHPQLYIALVSRAYNLDLEALKAILNSKRSYQYIGMIGSERRVRQVYQSLKNAGISEADLASIHAPIGLDIGALTPAEIAVSIAAQLILARRGNEFI